MQIWIGRGGRYDYPVFETFPLHESGNSVHMDPTYFVKLVKTVSYLYQINLYNVCSEQEKNM